MIIWLSDFNNNVIICFGTSVNVINVTFPIAFTTVVHLTFGIRYAKNQYGYDCVTALSTTGFTLYDCWSELYQMYIAIGY